MKWVDTFAERLEKLWKERGEDFRDWFYGSGFGKTPLQKLPRELDPNGNVYVKREDLQPGGNIKVRAASGILYLMKDGLEGVHTLTVASSGNFARTLPLVAEKLGLDVGIMYFILKPRLDDDPQLREELEKYGEVIPVPETGYCPVSGRDAGRAITNAMVQGEQPGYRYVDQHDGIGNPFGNLTLGEETSDLEEAVVVQGLGTCGSTLGHYYGRVFSGADTELVGLLPEDGRQVGLRNRAGQGESENFAEVSRIADKIIEVSNREAYETMVALWERGIPAGPSTGTNVAGALKIAGETEKDVITVVPDSAARYADFLRRNMKEILGRDFEEYEDCWRRAVGLADRITPDPYI